MNVWKIASRWSDTGTENSSIIDIFRKYNIVFAGRNTDYIKKSVRKNDLIAVTDGITVVSVGIILSKPKPLNEFEFDKSEIDEFKFNKYNIDEFKKDLKEKNVPYEEWIPAFKVKLYNLHEKETFEYTRGTFNKVHKPYDNIVKKNLSDILNNTNEIYFGDNKQFYIKKINLRNYKAIKNININIPSNTKWIFLTGNNGYGKTTILQAIAEGLYNQEINNLKITLKNQKEQTLIDTFEFRKYKNFADYGTNRTNLNNIENEKIKPTKKILGKSGYIFNFEKQFQKMQGIEGLKKKQELIVDILKKLIPILSKIEIIEDPEKLADTKVIYIEKDEKNKDFKEVEFSNLAMGLRSIIGFVTDMIFTLSDNQGDNIKIETLYGIVIIDEFDNHLHPKWQRDLVVELTKIFPKIQFIVSTHSPIPLLGAPENTIIINVQRTKEKGITAEKLDIDFSRLMPNSLLSSPIFDFEEFIAKSKPNNKFPHTEDKHKDITEKEKLQNELSEFLTDEKTNELLNLLKSDEDEKN